METLYYGPNHRFCIKGFNPRSGGRVYMVHDADWITDSEIRMGHISPTVAQFDDIKKVLVWCDQVLEGKIASVPHESNFEGWPELKERVNEFYRQREAKIEF